MIREENRGQENMQKQEIPLHFDADSQISNVIMAMKNQAHMDLEFHKANILSPESKELYGYLANKDLYGVMQKFFDSAVQEMAETMVKEYFEMFRRNGNFKRVKFSCGGQNIVSLMMEIADADENSALVAYTCRDIINMKYNRVGLTIDVLVVEECDEMDFDDKSVLNASDTPGSQAEG